MEKERYGREQEGSIFEKIEILREEAEEWMVPRVYPNRTIRRKYLLNKYPAHMSHELLHSSEFSIPRPFDHSNAHHVTELFCELFPGPLLANCISLEKNIVENKSISEMAEEYQIPEDNMKIRLVQYYLARLGNYNEQRDMKAVEKAGFELYVRALEKMEVSENNTTIMSD